jgi:ParB family chromosome partitioning protein
MPLTITEIADPQRRIDAIARSYATSPSNTLSRLLVEATVLLAAARTNPSAVLRDAAAIYKVDTDAIALKVKQEFAAKEKAKKADKSTATGKVKKAA